MYTKLISVETIDQFNAILSGNNPFPTSSIVIIENTKQVWTHGLFINGVTATTEVGADLTLSIAGTNYTVPLSTNVIKKNTDINLGLHSVTEGVLTYNMSYALKADTHKLLYFSLKVDYDGLHIGDTNDKVTFDSKYSLKRQYTNGAYTYTVPIFDSENVNFSSSNNKIEYDFADVQKGAIYYAQHDRYSTAPQDNTTNYATRLGGSATEGWIVMNTSTEGTGQSYYLIKITNLQNPKLYIKGASYSAFTLVITENDIFGGATANSAGSKGLVPAPPANTGLFLKSDGTWAVPAYPTKNSWNYDDRYITFVGVTDDSTNHNNQLRYVLNGTSNYFTVPYATNAGNSSTVEGMAGTLLLFGQYVYHNKLAFNACTTKYEYSSDGDTFTTSDKSAIANLFDDRSTSFNIALYKKVRITFDISLHNKADYLILQSNYTDNWGTEILLVEGSLDNSAWTSIYNNSFSCNSSYKVFKLPLLGNYRYIRLTFSQTGSSTEIPLSNIRILTPRLGDQGKDIIERPYTWDNQGRASVYYASIAGSVEWTNVSNKPVFVKSGTTAASGLVPAPSTTEGTSKYLREDATWQTPPNTWKPANTSLEGYVPTLSLNATNTIATLSSEYVLTYKAGTETTPVWRKLPTNAFSNTWTANSKDNAGYVAAPKNGNNYLTNKVWKTDSNGNPAWRDDSNTNTWRSIRINDNTTDSLGTGTDSGALIIKGTGATTVSFTDSKIVINSTNTWTAWAGATESAAGTAGYMPAATIALRNQFLRGDGSWVSLNNYSLPTASSTTLGGVKTGAAIDDVTGYTAVHIKDGVIYYKDTNSHYTANPVLGASNTAISNASSYTTNSTTYLNIIENSAKSGSIQITGSGGTSVKAKNGILTISSPSLGTGASNAAKGDHDHTLSIAADDGTNEISLTAGTKYKLTAGGKTLIFTTPSDANTKYKLTLNGTTKGATGGTDLGTFYAVATSDTTTANQVWMRNSSNNGYGWRTLGSNAFNSTSYLPLSGGTLTSSNHQVLTLRTTHTNDVKWVGISFGKNVGGTDTSYGGIMMSELDGALVRYKSDYTLYTILDASNYTSYKHAYTNLTGSGTTANLAIVSTGTVNEWTLKTLGSNAFNSTAYLPKSGGAMDAGATISWTDWGQWTSENPTYPKALGGLYWKGTSDWIKLFAEETAHDDLRLILLGGDDLSPRFEFRDKDGVATAYIQCTGLADFVSLSVGGTAVSLSGHTHNYVPTSDYTLSSVDVTKALSASWIDTGISNSSTSFTTTGTYAVLISTGNHYYSGIMSWYNGSGGMAEEVVLHYSGDGSPTRIYMRTYNGKIQLAADETIASTTYRIKIRKLI